MSGVPFSCCPVSPTSRFSSQEFRVLLLRRLWLPLPLLCTLAGVAVLSTPLATTVQRVLQLGLGRRGFSLESAAVRVWEAGGRVSVNFFCHLGVMDNRRLEVVADGLDSSTVDRREHHHGESTPKGRFSMPSKCHCGRRRERGRGRKRRIQNWQDEVVAPVWSCWLVKWEEGGQKRSWPR